MSLKRKLHKDEIDEILSLISPPPVLYDELREKVHEEVKNSIYFQLVNQEIYESQIPKLKNYISNYGAKSFLPPGTHVGMNTGESTGQPATQINLNAFHQAGQSSNKKGGSSDFQKKLSLKRDLDNSSTLIHFLNWDLSFEETFYVGKRFVSLRISELLDKTSGISFEILSTETANRDFYNDFIGINQLYTEITEADDYQGLFIRLKFDTQKLFIHNITLQEICDAMINKIKNKEDIMIIPFQGPTTLGFIDVYPNIRLVEVTGESNAKDGYNTKPFFQGVFEPNLSLIKIGKYPIVRDINVERYSTLKLIQGTEKDEANPGYIKIWIDPIVEKSVGIPVVKLIQLLETLGYDVDTSEYNVKIEEYRDSFYLGFLKIKYSSEVDFVKYLEDKIRESEKQMISNFQDNDILETTDIYRHAFYHVVFTTGSNLAEIRAHPDVCEFRTFSDSPLEIFEVLGLEAMRNYLEKEIFDLFESFGEHIAPRNITTMVDWISAGPKPISIGSKSVSKQNKGIFPQACFEDPITAITTGGVFGPTEKIQNSSASILFGVRLNTGTGAFDIKVDEETAILYRNLKSEKDPGASRLTSSVLSRKEINSLPGIDKVRQLFENDSDDSSFNADDVQESLPDIDEE